MRTYRISWVDDDESFEVIADTAEAAESLASILLCSEYTRDVKVTEDE